MHILLLVISILVFCLGLRFESNAKSSIHQIYAALYFLMATVIMCSAFVINSINILTSKKGKK